MDTNEDPIRHVYILGAGASIPLGGPSFNELLRDNPLVRRALDSESEAEEVKFVRRLHERVNGLYACFGLVAGNPDIEQLLERLDYCEVIDDKILMSQIEGQLGLPSSTRMSSKIDFLNRLIRIRLAIETSIFLLQLPDDSERWEPYKKWFESLSSSDTILTFNYDGVVEKLATLVGRDYFGTGNAVVQSLMSPPDGMPALLKLHGSFDWSYRGHVPAEIQSTPITKIELSSPITDWRAFISQGKHVLLGSPGLSKKRMSVELFRPLWQQASDALQKANIISIVGYSMPATDNLAKELILEAIAGNRNLKQINIVLGPDSNSPRARRVYEICKQVALSREGATVSNGVQILEREKTVRLSSMYAQDFLPLHRPKTLKEIEVTRLV